VFCLQDDPLYLIFVIKKYVVKNWMRLHILIYVLKSSNY
jgi:hypothetical protein